MGVRLRAMCPDGEVFLDLGTHTAEETWHRLAEVPPETRWPCEGEGEFVPIAEILKIEAVEE